MLQPSSSPFFRSIVQSRISMDEDYIINCVIHPHTKANEYSTMVDLINPNDDMECMITVFGEEVTTLEL